MHFIAMLGFAIPGQTIRYSVPVTLLSMLIAVVVVGAGLFITGFSRRGGARPLLAGGLAVGLGVASMHYLAPESESVPGSRSAPGRRPPRVGSFAGAGSCPGAREPVPPAPFAPAAGIRALGLSPVMGAAGPRPMIA